jgi:hypothetical protein
MSDMLKIADNQELPAADLMRMQEFREAQSDQAFKDAVDPFFKFAGFAITNLANVAIRIGDGRIYQSGIQYDRDADEGTSFDLTSGSATLPVIGKKIISVVVYPTVEEDVDVQPREFEEAVTDTEGNYTGNYHVESRNTATRIKRYANVALIPGTQSANPAPPVIGVQYLEVARLLCGTTGIESITYVEANRVKTNRDIDLRVIDIENNLSLLLGVLNSLVSDIGSINTRLRDLPSLRLISQHSADIARIKEQIGRPDSAIDYGTSTFGTSKEVDLSHAASMCRINGELTFGDYTIKEAVPGFANVNEPTQVKKETITLPVFNKVLVVDTMTGL